MYVSKELGGSFLKPSLVFFLRHLIETCVIELKVLDPLCPFCRQKNKKVKFQLHLKDNTNLELPKKGGA